MVHTIKIQIVSNIGVWSEKVLATHCCREYVYKKTKQKIQ